MITTKYDVWKEATLLFKEQPKLSLTKFQAELFKKFKGLITKKQMCDALRRHPEIVFIQCGVGGYLPEAMQLQDAIHSNRLSRLSSIPLL